MQVRAGFASARAEAEASTVCPRCAKRSRSDLRIAEHEPGERLRSLALLARQDVGVHRRRERLGGMAETTADYVQRDLGITVKGQRRDDRLGLRRETGLRGLRQRSSRDGVTVSDEPLTRWLLLDHGGDLDVLPEAPPSYKGRCHVRRSRCERPLE